MFAEELRLILSSHLLRTFFRMAARTFRPRVSAVQNIAGARVVEVLLVESIDDVVSAFVFLVAVDTGFAIHKTVKMLLHLDMRVDVLMAIKAFGIGNAPAWLMALQAVFVLKVFMPEDQRSWCEEFVQEAFELLFVAPLGKSEAAAKGTDDKHEDEEDLLHS